MFCSSGSMQPSKLARCLELLCSYSRLLGGSTNTFGAILAEEYPGQGVLPCMLSGHTGCRVQSAGESHLAFPGWGAW